MNEIRDEILLAEDEEHLRTSLRYSLEQEGWRVQDFPDGAELWAWWQKHPEPPKGCRRIVILDITMPRMDGLEVCRRLRGQTETLPLMFLSSRDEEFDRVLGLELGADDYLCKPFSLRELSARVKVLFRRYQAKEGDSSPTATTPNTLVHGELIMDEGGCTVEYLGSMVDLTITEFRILHHLVQNSGIVKTRDQLQKAAYPYDLYLSDRAMDSHIKRIRKKLGGQVPLETVYGMGYKWLK